MNPFGYIHKETKKQYIKLLLHERKKEIWLSHNKSPYTNRKFKQAKWQYQNATETLDYKTITDWLRTVS